MLHVEVVIRATNNLNLQLNICCRTSCANKFCFYHLAFIGVSDIHSLKMLGNRIFQRELETSVGSSQLVSRIKTSFCDQECVLCFLQPSLGDQPRSRASLFIPRERDEERGPWEQGCHACCLATFFQKHFAQYMQ